MPVTAKRTPSRAAQLAAKSQTTVECRAHGHMLVGTMETFKRRKGVDEVSYVGYRMRKAHCVRDVDGQCEYWIESVYDGQWGHDPKLSRSGNSKEYAVVGQGRGRYRVEALQELAHREGI